MPPCPSFRSTARRGRWKAPFVRETTLSPRSAKRLGRDALIWNLWGQKSFAYGLSRPQIRSLIIMADSMEEVIPHFLNPVATYQ